MAIKKQKTNKKPDLAELKGLRKKINQTDDRMLALLNQRALLAKKIAGIKKHFSEPVYFPGREEEILERLEKINPGPFPNESIRAVFREIISACRSLERTLKVVYLGPEATFTHIATRLQFGHKAELVSEPSIKDVFEEVEKREADFGVVPVENSTEGVVSHTLDMFLSSNLRICAEIILEVHHCLLSKADSLEKLQRIYAHSQALAQCRAWVRKNLPNLPILESASTSESARLASQDESAGAIASAYAGEYYGLGVLAERIEDVHNNFTRFLVIGNQRGEKTGKDLTMIMFSLKDRPGALYQALGNFAKKKINLTKIESRPLKSKAWEYVFFVELEGHIQDQKVKNALSELEKKCIFLRVLGSFPRTRKIAQEVLG